MIDAHTIQLALIALFIAIVGGAAFSDLCSLRISNRFSVALVVVFTVYVIASPQPIDISGSLLTASAILVGGFILFSFGFIGGGDAKLLSAVALWAGPEHVSDFLMITAIAGGVIGITMMTVDRMGKAYGMVTNSITEQGEAIQIPYGLAIAAGAGNVALKLSGL